jgi:hypothetical protein
VCAFKKASRVNNSLERKLITSTKRVSSLSLAAVGDVFWWRNGLLVVDSRSK